MRAARWRIGSSKRFAYLLAQELGIDSLSRHALYRWETGRARVPADALIAAAFLADETVDRLILEGEGIIPLPLGRRGRTVAAGEGATSGATSASPTS